MLGIQKKAETALALNFNTITSATAETHQSFYNESVQEFKDTCLNLEVNNSYSFARLSYNHGEENATFGAKTLGIQHMAALNEDVALPDVFLNDYYSQVLYIQII